MQATERERLNEAIALAQTGRKAEAYPVINRLLQKNPDSSILLLWNAFTTTNPIEANASIQRLSMVDPANPSLPGALQWLRTIQPQPVLTPTPTPAPAPMDAPPPVPTNYYEPMGEPVLDGSNFVMSQRGGVFLVSAIGLGAGIISLIALISITFLLRTNPYAIARSAYAWIGAVSSIVIFGTVFYFSSQDVLAKPHRARGRISNRQTERYDHKDRYGNVTDHDIYHYVDFEPDGQTGAPIRLRLTEDQFQISSRSPYADVTYSGKMHYVKSYQPLNRRL